MATPLPAAALRAPHAPGAPRDVPSVLCAALALAALMLLPWGMDGGASAMRLAGSAVSASARWPHYAASAALVPVLIGVIATLACAWFGIARFTALF